MPAKYDKRQTTARKSREQREKRFSENDAGTSSVNIGTSSSKPAFPGAAPPFKRKGEKGTKEKKKPAFLKAKEEESRAAASVMRMVLDYKRSVRKRRLAAIRGWRKALALGAAGLAGLAPMKAHAQDWEPPGQTQTASVQDQIQTLQKQIDAKFSRIDDRTKANKNFQASMQNFRDAWDAAQNPSEKLTALQSISTYLNYWASHGSEMSQSEQTYSLGPGFSPEEYGTTSVSQDDLQLPAFKAGYEDGKAYVGLWPGVSSDVIQQTATIRSNFKGYADQGQFTRDFIRGWFDGYITTHGPPGETTEAPTQDQRASAVTYSIKPGAIVARRSEDLLKLKRLSAQGDKAAVRKFYRELISTKAAWEVKQAGDLNINVSVEPAGNGIVKMQSPDHPDAYIAQDDLIPQ